MSSSNFKFDSSQDFQLAAIGSIVNLFEGQPNDAQVLTTTLSGVVASESLASDRKSVV